MTMKKVRILTISSSLILSFLSQTLFSDFASAKLKTNQSSLVITNTKFVSTIGTPIVLITSGGSGIRKVRYSTSGNGCTITGNLLSSQSETSCIVVATNPANGNYGSVTSSSKIFSFKNIFKSKKIILSSILLLLLGGTIVDFNSLKLISVVITIMLVAGMSMKNSKKTSINNEIYREEHHYSKDDLENINQKNIKKIHNKK